MRKSMRLLPLPTKEELNRLITSPAVVEPDNVNLILLLLNCAEIIRGTVYADMLDKWALSEGKFIFLMTLRDIGGPATISTIAHRIGVSIPAVSLMIKRMRDEQPPLIHLSSQTSDARAVIVTLSPEGSQLLDRVLPGHMEEVTKFADILSPEEKVVLNKLLEKLQAPYFEERAVASGR